ncbi:MAG: uracil-DNA glycosylase [Myxococcota bacterium]|nr:uracil-DNA glycosylase [Myxococcota bacterium]
MKNSIQSLGAQAVEAQVILDRIPVSWRTQLEDVMSVKTIEALPKLAAFLAEERRVAQVFPPFSEVFAALDASSPENVRVVILGQDPYHGEGQANGLSFSVCRGVRTPPSLVNIYKELERSLGVERPQHGDLSSWAAQGVLLLNTVLTVRAGQANSHRRQGWELLTDDLIKSINAHPGHRVFILWGRPSQKKRKLIDGEKHTIIESAHPSPLSARNGFFGSDPFRRTNEALAAHGQPLINWRLPS